MSETPKRDGETAPAARDDARHVAERTERPRLSRRMGVTLVLAAAAVALALVHLTGGPPARKTDERPPALTVRPTVRYEPPPPEPPPLPPPPPASPPALAPPPLPTQPVALPSTIRPAALPRPRPDRLLVFNAGGPSAAVGAERALDAESLAARLSPTPLVGAAAAVLPNRPYLLTQGTVFPCLLQTAMDSTLPGLVTCVIPEDVRGPTGLTLLDKGTRVVGEFRGGVHPGIERLFVLWTRAETPQGVVVALDSPASDALGRAGLSGTVDRHFWQRFGGALLLSVVQGTIQAGVAQASKRGTTTITTGETQGVIAESLRGSFDLPPTVRVPQGTPVSVSVARDLDFSRVYRLRAAGEPEEAE